MNVRFGLIIRLLLSAVLVLGFAAGSSAQSDPDIIRFDFGKRYELQDSYSILYDNTTASAKLKEFRIIFYDPEGQILLETATETHLLTIEADTYRLASPVSGFSEVGLSVLSLHEGLMTDFPKDIGAILGLSEMTKIPEPVEDVPDISPPPPPPIPTLTAAEKTDLAETASALNAFLSTVNGKLIGLETNAEVGQSTKNRLDQVLENTSTLSKQAGNADLTDLKTQIDALALEMSTAKTEADTNDYRSALEEAKIEILALQTQIKGLQNLNETEGADISNVMSSLTQIKDELDELEQNLANIDLPETISAQKIDSWEVGYLSFQTQLNSTPSSVWPMIFVIGIALLAVLGWLAKMRIGGKVKARPPKSALKDLDDTGVLFPVISPKEDFTDSPFKAGELNLLRGEMLDGQHSNLRNAYRATGRIGFPQKGIPTEKDYALGTGFLITDRHVLTNRHIHRMYGHHLLNPNDPGGIEFMAEKGLDASDFVPFKSQSPILLPGLDIAIYELIRPVKNRTPLAFKPVPAASLNGRKIAVIGYPDTRKDLEDLEDEVLQVLEEDPILAIKRLSWGYIFRHSTDDDETYGVETRIRKNKLKKFTMAAICHNASTMGGNSGSPVLDFETGDWVGVHFRGYPSFKKAEAANLAMAIDQLSSVTDVTDRR